MIKKNTIFSIGFLLAIAFLSIASVSALTPINDTLFTNTITNYSIYINETIYLRAYNLTDSGRIEFFGLVSNLTHTPKIYNINDTYTSILDIYELNNALIYNTNGSIYGNSDISLNDGNINITLPPNNACYVLDNFNLTEGVSREHSPISISKTEYSNGVIWSIKSNISTEVTIPTYLTIDCSRVGSITITPKDKETYTPSYTCTNGVLTISNANYTYSTDSNEIEVLYNKAQLDVCSGFFDAGVGFTGFIVILIIISIGGIVIVFLTGGDADIDVTTLIAGTIIVAAIVLSFGMVIINNINNC